MKNAAALIIFNSLFFVGITAAFEIRSELMTPPGETDNRAIPFAMGKTDAKVMLPVRTLYTGQVFNESHTIAAINYHETSDYDGVDLVVLNGDKICILPDIWNLIEATLEQKKIVPVQPWGRIEFKVKSIAGNKVECVFRSIISRTDAVVEKQFAVTVGSPKSALDLQVGN